MSASAVPAALARDVAVLALRLDRMCPGLVEAFTGARALRVHAAADRPSARSLVREAVRLRGVAGSCGLAPTLHAFVDGELRALELAARMAEGARPSLRTEIRESFDVEAVVGEPDTYRAAHDELDALLPGRGSLARRLIEYRRRDALAPGAGRAVAVTVLTRALREQSARLLPAPVEAGVLVDAGVSVEIVAGAPWSGFTRHLGGGRSVSRFSGDAPLRAGQLAQLVAHETYPGHHLEHLHRGRAARRQPERALSLTRSPRALVVEGLADAGLDVVVGPGWGAWAERVLGEANLVTDGELAERLDAAMQPLQRVRLDAALLLHGAGGEEAALAHLRRWLLIGDGRARHLLPFLTDPRWRAYAVTYVEGFSLVKAWTGDGNERVERYRELLAAPVVPAVLRARLAATPQPGAPVG